MRPRDPLRYPPALGAASVEGVGVQERELAWGGAQGPNGGGTGLLSPGLWVPLKDAPSRTPGIGDGCFLILLKVRKEDESQTCVAQSLNAGFGLDPQ